MRDELKGKVGKNECLILNIDDSTGEGTHWTCLFNKNGICLYFDSYGFVAPIEVRKYYNGYCSSFKIQAPDEVICGHYCIYITACTN